MARSDYAYPFGIDPSSGMAARANYGDHVEQMIRQVLLTSPGERVNLPEFGCGLRRLLFAPNVDAADPGATPTVAPPGTVVDALHATTQMLVRDAIDRWLGGQVQVRDVTVARDPAGGSVTVSVQYVLVETRSLRQTQVVVG